MLFRSLSRDARHVARTPVGKSERYLGESEVEPLTMDRAFAEFVEALHPSFECLMRMAPLKMSALPPKLPEKCIYLLSEGENHLYVGRTRKLRQRLRQHSVAGAQHNQAVFAFKLAREMTGRMAAAYSSVGSRAALCAEPEFSEAFKQAKGSRAQYGFAICRRSGPDSTGAS